MKALLFLDLLLLYVLGSILLCKVSLSISKLKRQDLSLTHPVRWKTGSVSLPANSLWWDCSQQDSPLPHCRPFSSVFFPSESYQSGKDLLFCSHRTAGRRIYLTILFLLSLSNPVWRKDKIELLQEFLARQHYNLRFKRASIMNHDPSF